MPMGRLPSTVALQGAAGRQGDEVALGQVIGAVGYLPAESLMPSHLHLECRRDGKYIDDEPDERITVSLKHRRGGALRGGVLYIKARMALDRTQQLD